MNVASLRKEEFNDTLQRTAADRRLGDVRLSSTVHQLFGGMAPEQGSTEQCSECSTSPSLMLGLGEP